MSAETRQILKDIEQLLGGTFTMNEASPRSPAGNPLHGLMAFKDGRQPKYLLDEQGRLVGLNFEAAGLDDDKWGALAAILRQGGVRLRALNLHGNQLRKFVLPPEIDAMELLDLEENPLEFPPQEIVKQGQAAVLRYLQAAAAQGTRDAFEVKMLIVGEGETGKTTLWNLLQDPRHPVPDHSQKTTVGIQIREGWSFSHLDRDGDVKVVVNLWDFGGQEIQYMTHQFFLSRRSFYVLLADGRREASNFSYWLDAISLLGRDPGQRERMPVLVVLNEKGVKNPSLPYEPENVADQYQGLDITRRDVDFARLEDGRFDALVFEIKNMLCRRMPHLPLVVPCRWDDVRSELERLKLEGVKHVSHAEFVRACQAKGIQEQQEQDDVSQFFHDLGFVLHFREPRLLDFVVLDPKWAVKAVYAVLEHREVKEVGQGRFDGQQLRNIWTQKGYSAEAQDKLLGLMLKDGFDVCFEAKEDGRKLFIAPSLLPEVPPEGASWTDSPEVLRYVYHYPFMPSGIVGRLIVRLHEDIEGFEDGGCRRMVVWKNGVHLRKDGCRARVRFVNDRKDDRRIIMIEVQGPRADDRKHVLRDVRKELGKIHGESFPSLRFFEKIPCNCEECKNSQEPFEHDYSKLEERRRKNVPTAECGKSYKPVSVQQLLDGVFPEKSREGEEGEVQQPTRTRILFLEANPVDTVRLRLNEELQKVAEELRQSTHGDKLDIFHCLAATTDRLRKELLKRRPNIVHFSGHGTSEGIYLGDGDGTKKLVGTDALAGFFRLLKDDVQCVVLNCCYSKPLAEAMNEHVPCVIGMSSSVPDDVATSFAVGFYNAIGEGRSIPFAYEAGRSNIALAGFSGEENMIPVLLRNEAAKRRA